VLNAIFALRSDLVLFLWNLRGDYASLLEQVRCNTKTLGCSTGPLHVLWAAISIQHSPLQRIVQCSTSRCFFQLSPFQCCHECWYSHSSYGPWWYVYAFVVITCFQTMFLTPNQLSNTHTGNTRKDKLASLDANHMKT